MSGLDSANFHDPAWWEHPGGIELQALRDRYDARVAERDAAEKRLKEVQAELDSVRAFARNLLRAVEEQWWDARYGEGDWRRQVNIARRASGASEGAS